MIFITDYPKIFRWFSHFVRHQKKLGIPSWPEGLLKVAILESAVTPPSSSHPPEAGRHGGTTSGGLMYGATTTYLHFIH